MMTSQEHVVITGGAGYIGSVLSRHLLNRGYRVTVIDNFMYRQNSLLDCCSDDRFSVIRGDCRDERLMTDVIRDADTLIPLAALVGAPLCNRDRIGAYSTNLPRSRAAQGRSASTLPCAARAATKRRTRSAP